MARQAQNRRNSNPARNRNNAANRNNSNSNREERVYERMFDAWEPQNEHEADLLRRFTTPPRGPPLYLTVNGQAIAIPRYNGVAWWFPTMAIEQPHPVEDFFYTVFTIVNTMQTACLMVVWPIVIIYHLRWSAIPALVLLVPLGSHLEDSFGDNYGTAYASMNVLRLAMYFTKYALSVKARQQQPEWSPNRLVVALFFVMTAFLIGNALSLVEKHVLGRTWNAALVTYAELAFWVCSGWKFFYA